MTDSHLFKGAHDGAPRSRRVALAALSFAALASLNAPAQQQIFYPARGQSQSQQSNDIGQCQQWAKQNTGIDPMTVAQQANQPPPQQAQGGRVRGAAGGAATGAAIGAITGDAGKGAAAGAVGGAMIGGARQRQQHRAQAAQQQANQQQTSQEIATFNRALSACMSGRGYTVQ
ncbi:glycine zipper domain-containing protein [Caballeronia sp. Lep1P3]|uniref:glycine zipper domain-containing protein n=1 Tax=Caballeronia sp. Lep1P3 TaxID=2878150 RepID=UPI001FD2C2A3|nr:glycine zipper domain-containing protein [Caballeronia sp. Lep1P3]